MMDYGSQGNGSDEVRNSIFNTINLINDLESGVQRKPAPGGSQKDKDVSLSDSFVNGIKDKLVDYSRAGRSEEKQMAGISSEDFMAFQQKLSTQFAEMQRIISSNESEIRSLKDMISGLKQEIAEKRHVNVREEPEPREEVQTGLDTPVDGSYEDLSIFQQADTPSGMIHDRPTSDDQPVQKVQNDTIFDPMAATDDTGRNFTPSAEAVQPGAEKMQETVAPTSETQDDKPANQSNDPNPRVGSYESGDVLIEKYFYYGNK